jgi:hypothetical protein
VVSNINSKPKFTIEKDFEQAASNHLDAVFFLVSIASRKLLTQRQLQIWN